MYRMQLENMYFDWINNYITIALFAEHNGLTEQQAKELIDLAKSVVYSDHPEK